jgi:hypothetical protein
VKIKSAISNSTSSHKNVEKPIVIVKTINEVDILDDGFSDGENMVRKISKDTLTLGDTASQQSVQIHGLLLSSISHQIPNLPCLRYTYRFFCLFSYLFREIPNDAEKKIDMIVLLS